MQIDFHHAVTYVVARLAGFARKPASTIAYCAQYVDDATNAGIICFDNGAMYRRISSAHKTLDYRNFKSLANHQVWLPFHFLPGNSGLPAGQNPAGSFINKIICTPDSPVAQDMIRECIEERDKEYSLHRLGVTMHVYADTWAHQGFAGVNHEVNIAKKITGPGGGLDKQIIKRLVNFFVGEALPLGHGSVLSYPDRPYLKWGYTNGLGKVVRRDNPRDFLVAADCMCRAMQRFRAGDADAEVPGLPSADKKRIGEMLRNIKSDDGDERHAEWLKAIANGEFSFGADRVSYIPKGKNSWKHKAIGTKEWVDDKNEIFPFKPSFLQCDWKRFHDALQAHRFGVLHNILPRYGIVAA